MENVVLKRQCGSCDQIVNQSVSFEEQDGRIKIVVYLAHCLVCKGFLRAPTPREIRRAIITNEKKE
jgi:hypothetical protein